MAIGFVEDLSLSPSEPSACLLAGFSTTRVIPPFAEGSRSIDWRDWGIIRPIDNQGICGTCYSFSTAHSVESVNGIRTGKVYEISE